MDGSIVFAIPPGKYNSTCAFFSPPKSTTQMANRSVQPFLQGSLVWQTDHATWSVTIGRIYVPSTVMQPNNEQVVKVIWHKAASPPRMDGSVVFFRWRQYARPFSPKNLPLPIGGSGPPSNTWFPGPTQVLNPKGSSISAAVFAGLTSVTDRPTDHTTGSVTIGRIYVRSTAMRPNNN